METVKLNEKVKELETVVKENNKEIVQLKGKYKELEKLVKENNQEKIKVEDKFKEIDKVFKAFVRKVLSLEEEMKVIKAKHPEHPGSEVNDMVKSIKEKDDDAEKENTVNNFSTKKESYDKKDKDTDSKARKENKFNTQKNYKKEGMLNCNKCEYECKKESNLEKHRIAKHEDHICQECKDTLPSFIELMKHVAKHHCKNMQEEVKEAQVKEQGETETDGGFVLTESTVDKLRK